MIKSIPIRRWRWAVPVFLALLAPTAGCKDPANEVRASCETRTTWKHAFNRNCTNCLAKAATPKCNVKCTDKDYSGKCDSEHEAMRKEPTCEGVAACLHECKRGDCACEEACYEGKARCKQLAGTADACTTSVCDAHCR